MLGYVKIFKPELKVREYEIYCGYYCGVCKSIGSRYGQLPRMVLSYDAAFLALLLEAVSPAQDAPVQEHCIAHPVIRKKAIIRNAAIDYAADVMLILAWYKLMDDANDEGRLYAKSTMLLFRRLFKKLRRRYPALCSSMEENLAELSRLEKEKCPQLDMAAESFSRIMEAIFREGFREIAGDIQESSGDGKAGESQKNPGDGKAGESQENAGDGKAGEAQENAFHGKGAGFADFSGFAKLSDKESDEGTDNAGSEASFLNTMDAFASIGYHMGKWIYLIDAIDDIEENVESGAYNPLLYRFSFDASQEDTSLFRDRIEEDLKFNLYHYLAMIGNCMDALEIKKNKGIIENVIYFGLNRKTEEIIEQTDPEKRI